MSEPVSSNGRRSISGRRDRHALRVVTGSRCAVMLVGASLAGPAPAQTAAPVQVSSWKESIEFIDVGLERRQVAQRQTLIVDDGQPREQGRSNTTQGFIGMRIDTGVFGPLIDGARLRYRLQGNDAADAPDHRIDFIAQSRLLQQIGAPWMLDVEASLGNPGERRVAAGKIGMVVPLTTSLSTALAMRSVHSGGDLSVVWPFELRFHAGARTALALGTTFGYGAQAGATQARMEWPLSTRARMVATLEHRRFDSSTAGRVGVDVRWY